MLSCLSLDRECVVAAAAADPCCPSDSMTVKLKKNVEEQKENKEQNMKAIELMTHW